MGLARMGAVLKYIPDPVVVGFTSGIGLIIFVGQLKYFLGVTPAGSGTYFHRQVGALAAAAPGIHLPTVAVGLVSLVTVMAASRVLRRIPAPLVALVVATVAERVFRFEGVATIGTLFGGIPRQLPALGLPIEDFTQIVRLIGPAFTIALLGAIESLLSATIADGMAGARHDSNQELIGQGIANVLAPLFGGFAATGAIAPTATNIRNGATGPLAGAVHSVFLLVVILALAPLAADVPLAALAAILFVVAWNMSDVARFWKLARTAPRPDVALLLITFLLTVFTDLVVAVNTGVMLASLVFMRRMAQAVSVEAQSAELLSAESGPGQWQLPAGSLVYQIDGPFFFAAAEKLDATLRHSQSRPTTLILRLGRMPFIDSTGVSALEKIVADFRRHGTRVVLCELAPNVAAKLARTGLLAQLGPDAVYPSLADFARGNG
jgi:sulfate permease, SulP family